MSDASVLSAVERDLANFGELADGALAAAARALARELDNPGNSATSKSMCARALLEMFDRLQALAPPAKEADKLDELNARRAKRLRSAAAAAVPRS